MMTSPPRWFSDPSTIPPPRSLAREGPSELDRKTGCSGKRPRISPEVLGLYRKRERARRLHEHGVFARFRYNDLKEAARDCGGRGPYANSMVGRSGAELGRGCAAERDPGKEDRGSWRLAAEARRERRGGAGTGG